MGVLIKTKCHRAQMDEDANWLFVWVKYWNNVDLLEGAMEQQSGREVEIEKLLSDEWF